MLSILWYFLFPYGSFSFINLYLQEMVDNQPYFEDVFVNFQKWLAKTGACNSNSIFVTCGDWDLKVMLPNQCQQSGIAVPTNVKHWINIKKVNVN